MWLRFGEAELLLQLQPHRPEGLGQGDGSIHLLVSCVMIVAPLLEIADVDGGGGKATWSLQVSVQPARGGNMLEIPLVSPGLLGWFTVGVRRCFCRLCQPS